MTTPAATRAAPLPTAERSPAPDVARGVALLGIALANSVVHVVGQDLGPSLRPVDGTTADRVVDALVGLLVDNRSFPLFTLLVAYGTAVVVRRQAERGAPWPEARRLLVRRSLALLLLGVAHLVLLFEGDILTSYGFLGLGLVLLVRAPDRTLVVVGLLALLPLAALSGLDGLDGGGAAGSASGVPWDTTSAVGALAERAFGAVFLVVVGPVFTLLLVSSAVVGLLLARRRVLERPAEHLPLLRRLVVVGLPVSLVGAVPLVLTSTGVVALGGLPDYVVGALHGVTGVAGAVAFAALVALLVGRRQQAAARAGTTWRPGGAWGAASAVGRRSLTCYLLQSVVMVPLLAPWGAGLGVGAGTARVAAVGVATYALTVVVAVLLERAGRRGPAEVLLRWMVYGRRERAVAAPA